MIRIVYATVTGNTELVVQHVQKLLKEGGISDVELVRAESFEAEKFKKDEKYIVAASTWNLGEMNQFLEHIYEDLLKNDLNGIEMAFLGLGDSIYGEEHFCMSVKDFRKRALDKGAKELGDALYIDGEPESQLDSVVKEWVDLLLPLMK